MPWPPTRTRPPKPTRPEPVTLAPREQHDPARVVVPLPPRSWVLRSGHPQRAQMTHDLAPEETRVAEARRGAVETLDLPVMVSSATAAVHVDMRAAEFEALADAHGVPHTTVLGQRRYERSVITALLAGGCPGASS